MELKNQIIYRAVYNEALNEVRFYESELDAPHGPSLLHVDIYRHSANGGYTVKHINRHAMLSFEPRANVGPVAAVILFATVWGLKEQAEGSEPTELAIVPR